MSGVLDGKAVVVISQDAALAGLVAAAFSDQGGAVGLVGASSPAPTACRAATLTDRGDVDRACAEVAAMLGPVELVVIPLPDPAGASSSSVADMDDAAWIERCETPLKVVRVGLQAAYGLLRGKGGQIVLLVPTSSVTGAAGFAAASAAGEGVRAMAKAAARSWGADGIRVNCIAVDRRQLSPAGGDGPAAAATANALGYRPDLAAAIIPFIALLTGDAARIVTGATIMLDGGDVMLP